MITLLFIRTIDLYHLILSISHWKRLTVFQIPLLFTPLFQLLLLDQMACLWPSTPATYVERSFVHEASSNATWRTTQTTCLRRSTSVQTATLPPTRRSLSITTWRVTSCWATTVSDLQNTLSTHGATMSPAPWAQTSLSSKTGSPNCITASTVIMRQLNRACSTVTSWLCTVRTLHMCVSSAPKAFATHQSWRNTCGHTQARSHTTALTVSSAVQISPT